MAEYQEFGVTREGMFLHGDGEEARLHNLKHICPPANGDYNLFIIDNIQTRFNVPANQITNVELKVFRELNLNLPTSVRARVSARLGHSTSSLIMWIIEQNDIKTYPSQLIRLVQDRFVKALVDNRRGPHTIHWHGIEPSTMNDGVGKHSFEISGGTGDGDGGKFTYQFHVHQAGTFFFHCHKNTVHHFEMGMFGLLIIDPPAPQNQGGAPVLTAPYATGGPGYAAGRLDTENPYNPGASNLIRYDQEKLWVADDMDSAWHNHVDEDHSHNMQDCNPGDPMAAGTFYEFGTSDHGVELNNFQPDVFAVTGVVLDYGETGPGGTNEQTTPHYDGTVSGPLLSVTAGANEKILIRFLNASYSIIDLKLPVDATIIAMGGFPLGATARTRYSKPYVLPAGAVLASITARRFDLIIDTSKVSQSVNSFATLTYYDWIKGRPGGKRAEIRIPINITV